MDIFSDLASDAFNIIYKESKRKKNQKLINNIIDNIATLGIRRIQPYMYAIMALLILLFLMNCFQFWYYVKHLLHVHKQGGIGSPIALSLSAYDN